MGQLQAACRFSEGALGLSEYGNADKVRPDGRGFVPHLVIDDETGAILPVERGLASRPYLGSRDVRRGKSLQELCEEAQHGTPDQQKSLAGLVHDPLEAMFYYSRIAAVDDAAYLYYRTSLHSAASGKLGGFRLGWATLMRLNEMSQRDVEFMRALRRFAQVGLSLLERRELILSGRERLSVEASTAADYCVLYLADQAAALRAVLQSASLQPFESSTSLLVIRMGTPIGVSQLAWEISSSGGVRMVFDRDSKPSDVPLAKIRRGYWTRSGSGWSQIVPSDYEGVLQTLRAWSAVPA